ncbi:MAG: flagellar export chaperone FliS [Fibrobacteria bacterium]|nr:flagellar export chaperone FliS [Fibrobacteria bacterium]
MPAAGYQSYQSASISTADRGKLIIMIYDHCLKWCKIARENLGNGDIEAAAKAIFKVQDGITELTCSLDMDQQNDIVNNLFNLYNFYNRHLSQALTQKDTQPIQDVETMLTELRLAWLQAIDTVRKDDIATLKESSGNQLRMVG